MRVYKKKKKESSDVDETETLLWKEKNINNQKSYRKNRESIYQIKIPFVRHRSNDFTLGGCLL